jgi:hypothetical protein
LYLVVSALLGPSIINSKHLGNSKSAPLPCNSKKRIALSTGRPIPRHSPYVNDLSAAFRVLFPRSSNVLSHHRQFQAFSFLSIHSRTIAFNVVPSDHYLFPGTMSATSPLLQTSVAAGCIAIDFFLAGELKREFQDRRTQKRV